MLRVNREELAWAAGLYGGEGSTTCGDRHILRHGRSYSSTFFALTMSNTDLKLLERFQAAVGGLGRIYDNRESRPNRSQSWQWQNNSFEHGQAVLALLWEWLDTTKKKQAFQALQRHVMAWRKRQPNFKKIK